MGKEQPVQMSIEEFVNLAKRGVISKYKLVDVRGRWVRSGEDVRSVGKYCVFQGVSGGTVMVLYDKQAISKEKPPIWFCECRVVGSPVRRKNLYGQEEWMISAKLIEVA